MQIKEWDFFLVRAASSDTMIVGNIAYLILVEDEVTANGMFPTSVL